MTPKSLLQVLEQTSLRPLSLSPWDKENVRCNQQTVNVNQSDILMIDVSSIAYHLYFKHCTTVTTSELKELIPILLFKRIIHLASTFKTGNVLILWDSKTNDRKDMLPTYKGQRLVYKTEAEIARLMIMKKATRSFRKRWAKRIWPNNIVQKGKECDDLMAMLSRTIVIKRPRKIVMAVNDGDIYQLLSDTVNVYALNMDTLIGPSDFREKFGYSHKHVPTAKAICGCHSDNVKGVGGVAEKTFLKLLNGCGKTLKTVIDRWKIVTHNMKLVALPFDGTRVPIIKPFGMDMKVYREFCKENGLIAFAEKEKHYGKLFNRGK